ADAPVRDDVFDARPVWSHLSSGTEYKLSAYLFAEVHAEAGEGHDVAMMNGSPGVDTLGASATEVSLSGTNIANLPYANYAKHFDEIIAGGAEGVNSAILTDAFVDPDSYGPPEAIPLEQLAQFLWLDQFERIERWGSATGSKTDEIDNIDQVFAWWE
ncbi:MAG: hypothetical protein GXY83_40450, partial [Rhodopirellula sp.]|nr:hypothetical protein [Rhodopirellula sp.]